MVPIFVPREEEISTWVEECAKGKLDFGELCRRVAARGYKTTSLHEWLRAIEVENKKS